MKQIAIGAIRGPWGIHGWLKVMSFSGEWSHFRVLRSLYLQKKESDSGREFTVEDFRMQQGSGMFKLLTIESPEAGRTLNGHQILVSQEQLAPLNKDEWYLKDLVGLKLIGKDTVYGRIVAIMEAHDSLLEVERSNKKRFLVPFRSEFVGKPDLEKKTLFLKNPYLAEEM